MKTFTVNEALQPLLEQMSHDMAVPVEGLVNQALFNWATLHGYANPSLVTGDDLDWSEVISKGRRVFLVLEDREVEVEGERFLVGRDVSCQLSIESARMSRQHAAFTVRPDGLVVEDLGSSNGTWFNGARITHRALLDGDELFFGDVLARVEYR